MGTIKDIHTMVLGKKYKGYIIDHDKHSSTVSYMFYCGEHSDSMVIATKLGYVFAHNDDISLVAGEYQHHSDGTPYSVIIYDEEEE